MSKRGTAKAGTTVGWSGRRPGARATYGVELVIGQRAIVVTFDGPVDITVGQQIDELFLEPEGVKQVRTVDMFEGEDGKVRTVIGIRGDSCARMSSKGWTKKDTAGTPSTWTSSASRSRRRDRPPAAAGPPPGAPTTTPAAVRSRR